MIDSYSEPKKRQWLNKSFAIIFAIPVSASTVVLMPLILGPVFPLMFAVSMAEKMEYGFFIFLGSYAIACVLAFGLLYIIAEKMNLLKFTLCASLIEMALIFGISTA